MHAAGHDIHQGQAREDDQAHPDGLGRAEPGTHALGSQGQTLLSHFEILAHEEGRSGGHDDSEKSGRESKADRDDICSEGLFCTLIHRFVQVSFLLSLHAVRDRLKIDDAEDDSLTAGNILAPSSRFSPDEGSVTGRIEFIERVRHISPIPDSSNVPNSPDDDLGYGNEQQNGSGDGTEASGSRSIARILSSMHEVE